MYVCLVSCHQGEFLDKCVGVEKLKLINFSNFLVDAYSYVEKIASNYITYLFLAQQAIRNERDLESLNVPAKYRHMNTFHKYYSGEKAAPIPTIFIGGNHEASNYMWEL